MSIKNRMQTNNTKLNNLLESIKSLPEAGADGGLEQFVQGGYLSTFNTSRITRVFPNAFTMRKNLTLVSLQNCSQVWNDAFYRCDDLSTVILPTCKYIYTSAFGKCYELKKVEIPSCTAIGESAFYMCEALQSINTPATYIQGYAFSGCSGLQQIRLPECTHIGSYAFYQCKSLQLLQAEKLEQVGSYAFAYCNALQTLNLPKCYYIDNQAFRGMKNLTKVYLPECQRIYSSAFAECASLHTVELGKEATDAFTKHIGSNAFYKASNLMNLTLYYPFVMPLSASNALQSTPMFSSKSGVYGSIYVPAHLVSRYQSATNWVTYSSRITAITGVTGKIIDHINATYTGGEVLIGTSTSQLMDRLEVLVCYSDGTTESIDTYTILGCIDSINNTLTILYNGYSVDVQVVGYEQEKELINFAIDGITYTAEKEMTIRQWFHSEYNTYKGWQEEINESQHAPFYYIVYLNSQGFYLAYEDSDWGEYYRLSGDTMIRGGDTFFWTDNAYSSEF